MMRRTGLVLGLLVALVILPTRLMAQSLDELMQQAITAERAENYIEFENIVRKGIQIYPNEARFYYGLGITSERRGKLEEAIAAFRQAIKLNPDDADFYNNLGNALRQQGKLEEAIAAFRQAIKLNPDDADYYYNLGLALRQQGKLEEAITAFRQAITFKTDDADAYYNLGLALYDQKKLEEAIAVYRQAIKLKPDDADAYYNLGIALKQQGKLEEAITAYRQAIKLKPNFANAYINLGVALYNQKKLEEAITAYRQAIKLKPDDATAYNNLGGALYDQRKQEEAVTAFRQAINLKPDYATVYNNLGVALRDQKKLEEAISAYQKALSLPDDTSGTPTTAHASAHNNLGGVYQQQGKLNEAIQEYEAAVKIDPNFEYAQNNLKEAQRLFALKQQPAQLIALNETKYLPDDPLTPIKRSIVKIKIVFPGNAKGASYGTGYVIKRQGNQVWIITNRHVVVDKDTNQRGTNLEIEPYYGETLPNIPRSRCTAKIVKVSNNDNLDLALLETTQLPNDIQPLTLEANPPSANSSVTIIGHPGQSNWLEYKATFMSIKPSSGNLLIDVNLGKGASGSPVLDPNRKVIGIMVRTVNESNTNSEAIGIGHPMNLVLQQIAQWGVTIP